MAVSNKTTSSPGTIVHSDTITGYMPLAALGLILATQPSPTPMPRIGIRAFKAEREMEIWGSSSSGGTYRLLAKYPIAAISGELGPKRREGDLQVPEGFYFINRFNPYSQYHLSLGLNYPNSEDRRFSDPNTPGKDIFIHGNHVSAGCLAMTDAVIDVIYRLAIHARDAGQRNIPVSIFPCRMTASNWSSLNDRYAKRPDLIQFWSTLRPGYDGFERTHRWTRPHVGRDGTYVWPELTAAR